MMEQHLNRLGIIAVGFFGVLVVVWLGITAYDEYVASPADRARLASCRDRALKASLDGEQVAVVFIPDQSIRYKNLGDDFCYYSQFDVATPEQIAAYEKRTRDEAASIEADRRAFEQQLNAARKTNVGPAFADQVLDVVVPLNWQPVEIDKSNTDGWIRLQAVLRGQDMATLKTRGDQQILDVWTGDAHCGVSILKNATTSVAPIKLQLQGVSGTYRLEVPDDKVVWRSRTASPPSTERIPR